MTTSKLEDSLATLPDHKGAHAASRRRGGPTRRDRETKFQVRGFTLVEMMVTVVLAGIGMIGAMAVIVGQTQGNRDQGRAGDAQDNARRAMDVVFNSLVSTGLGLPPPYVFGPSGPASLAQDNSAGGDAYSTCAGTDVIDVHARDPRDAWTTTAAATSSTVWTGTLYSNPSAGSGPGGLTSQLDLAWPMGIRLLIVPGAGTGYFARTAAARGQGTLSVALNPAESAGLTAANLGTAAQGPDAAMVVTTRFRVSCVDPLHPTLVLENDTDSNQDGALNPATDEMPVASDIEDFQIVYLIDGNEDGAYESTEPALSWAQIQSWSPSTTYPALQATSDVLVHIKAIQVLIVARSAFPAAAPAQGVTISAPFNPVANHVPAVTAADRYYRRALSETIFLNNRNTTQPYTFTYIGNEWL